MGHMRAPSHPVRQYRCDDCGEVFQKRYDPAKEPIVTCIHCGDPNVHRIFKSPTGQTLDGVEPELIRAG